MIELESASHTGIAAASFLALFVQCILFTQVAVFSLCWAQKPVPYTISHNAGDPAVSFRNSTFPGHFFFHIPLHNATV